MSAPKRFAIIPARGGSKRLPRKNIAPFLGKPILAYTIEAALEAGLFGKVVVSTEDEEIALVAEKYGAEVARRDPELARDASTIVEVCLDFLDRESRAGRTWDQMCCLYATAPLRTAEDIRAVVGLLEPGRCDFAMAVTAYLHYPHAAARMDADDFLTPLFPDLINRRASELGRLCVGNGSAYAVAVDAFLSRKTFNGPGLRGHMMPLWRSVDIDTREELELAELFARKAKDEGIATIPSP